MFDKQNTRELNEQKAREYGKRIVDLLAAKQYKEIISAVDEIDESKTISDDEDYTIRLVPYDNGNRISFKYEKVVNTTKIQGEIDAIKAELSETDYQVIKCYEASLVGEELPYDIKALHEDRNEKRAQINALETNLTNLMAL